MGGRKYLKTCAGACALGLVTLAASGKGDDAAPRIEAAPPPPIERAIDHGDNAWVLASAALVLMMTTPGLALFYGGLVRKKNVLSVMMQCIFLAGLMTVVWVLWGYSLVFGGTQRWIGNGDYVFLRGMEPLWEHEESVIPMHPALGIPMLTHMVFHGMFFIFTPVLICGAFAERMKFSTMVVFMVLWGTLVYCPIAHCVWGGGALFYGKLDAIAKGTLDFAGGTVVHISSGVSALVCALLLGKRLGYGSDPMPPHNLTYTAIGAALLWVGWFGFNAGSALAADGVAASAFVATHLAAAAGALAWPMMEWTTRGKPTVLGTCTGAVAGLVCITPAAGYVTHMPALAMGFAAGIVCFFACITVKSMFGYDDSLDAFGVHGVGGTLGVLLTGVFATRAIGTVPAPNHEKLLGLIEGGDLIKGQAAATALCWVFAAAVTFTLLKILDVTLGLRVSTQRELQGLDLAEHGEEGYIFL